jgi:succinate dehydrogenase / fumarate reductase, cytochrome b subunit
MADQKPSQRPLSPHLQVYRPMLSMMMSITHRITGFALFFGTALFVWWLYAAANAPTAFEQTQYVFGHWFGRIVLFGFTWALLHHALGGIRHFIWDSGRGFELATVEKLVKANLIGSIVLTLLLWAIAYGVIS